MYPLKKGSTNKVEPIHILKIAIDQDQIITFPVYKDTDLQQLAAQLVSQYDLDIDSDILAAKFNQELGAVMQKTYHQHQKQHSSSSTSESQPQTHRSTTSNYVPAQQSDKPLLSNRHRDHRTGCNYSEQDADKQNASKDLNKRETANQPARSKTPQRVIIPYAKFKEDCLFKNRTKKGNNTANTSSYCLPAKSPLKAAVLNQSHLTLRTSSRTPRVKQSEKTPSVIKKIDLTPSKLKNDKIDKFLESLFAHLTRSSKLSLPKNHKQLNQNLSLADKRIDPENINFSGLSSKLLDVLQTLFSKLDQQQILKLDLSNFKRYVRELKLAYQFGECAKTQHQLASK